MRRAPAQKRTVAPDPVFRSLLVSQVINKVLLKGKKDLARSIVYDALETIEQRTSQDPTIVLKRAVDNICPSVEVRSRRVGGSSYQVPVEIRPARRVSLALRWLSQFARTRSGKSMREKLAAELLDASNNTGAAVKKREDVHRMAEANKAFAHYRW